MGTCFLFQVGKYLASQSDDKSLRVWKTADWAQEVIITEPFEECGGIVLLIIHFKTLKYCRVKILLFIKFHTSFNSWPVDESLKTYFILLPYYYPLRPLQSSVFYICFICHYYIILKIIKLYTSVPHHMFLPLQARLTCCACRGPLTGSTCCQPTLWTAAAPPRRSWSGTAGAATRTSWDTGRLSPALWVTITTVGVENMTFWNVFIKINRLKIKLWQTCCLS